MEHLLLWNPEDWTVREAYELMIADLGGAELVAASAEAREAQQRVESRLNPELRRLYAEAEDASADASAVREHAATRAALVHGVAIGAALAAFPGEDAERLVSAEAALTTELLASGLAPSTAIELTRTILDALARADGVAAAPGWTGGHRIARARPARTRPEGEPEE